MRAGGTTVHELGTGRGTATIVGLRRLIRHGRFDVVHTHLYRACVQGRFAARLAGVPAGGRHRVPPERAAHRGPPGLGRARALYLAGERLGRVTIAVTPAVAGRLRAWGVPDARITVIPKAVDAGRVPLRPALRAAVRGPGSASRPACRWSAGWAGWRPASGSTT
jgi:hypothetical protein